MAVRTITCIPGVTGDWRHAGGGVHYDTRGFFGVDWAALWRDDLRARPARALHMTRLGEGLLDRRDPPVQALLVLAANPAASVPDQTRVRRGLSRDDLFTVVVDHFVTDTARYADILLPGTMQIEHDDLLIAYGHLYIAWNQAGGAAAGRVPADHRDLPAPGPAHGPDRAGALRQRRDDGPPAAWLAAIRRWPASRSRRCRRGDRSA